jgi:hypothetical protein
MRTSFRRIVAGVVSAAVLAALPAAAEAAPASTTFQVQGAEIAFTSTRGTFVGRGLGSAGDRSAWKAVVDHTPLSSLPATITGGRFTMATLSSTSTPDFVVGNFTGGTIAVVDPGLGCTNQTFDVSGDVGGVTTTTTSGGSGSFDVLLTHYRVRLFGRCVSYAATVTGTASFAY